MAVCSRLPEDKLFCLADLLQTSIQVSKLTLKELQALVGHLNFACRVVTPGRPFLWWLGHAMAGLRKTHLVYRVSVSHDMREDVHTWLMFLSELNGVSFCQEERLLEANVQVHSDAAGVCGFGIYCHGRWCTAPWPEEWFTSGITKDLTFLELFPIMVAVHIWDK